MRWELGGLPLTALFPLAGAAPRELPDGYARRFWQMQDGLPENTVQAFAQTPDHFLRIGTSGGLVRFDGARLVQFDRDHTLLIRQDGIFSSPPAAMSVWGRARMAWGLEADAR